MNLVPANNSFSETIEMKLHRERKREVRKDIAIIEEALDRDDIYVKKIHQYIDGKYSAYIKDWGKGMLSYNMEFGFMYDYVESETLRENLLLMKSKLEGFMVYQEMPGMNNPASQQSVITNIQNTVNNQVSIGVAIDKAKEDIEELTALSKNERDELLVKLDELKTILDSKEKKNSKWEKAKPIFKYIIDKGLDVARIVLPLIQNV